MQDNKILAFWERTDKAKSDLSNAENRFREKTYYEMWHWAKVGATYLAYTLPIISILSGFTALAGGLGSIIPYALIAGTLAIGLLAVLELGKGKIIQTTTELLYTNRSKAIAGAGFCVLLAFASGYASIVGAEKLHKQYGDPKTAIEARHTADKDSIRGYYSSLIEGQEKALADFKQSVSYRGKINIHNPANRKAIGRFNEAISQLQTARAGALAELSQKRAESIAFAGNEFEQNKTLVLAIIIAIELLILLANFYPIHFDYCISKQAYTIKNNIGQTPINVQGEHLANILRTYTNAGSNTLILPPNAGSNGSSNGSAVGFKQGAGAGSNAGSNGSSNLQNAEHLSTKDRAYLQKYENVVDCIQTGLNEKQTLAQTNVGRSTFYNVKRIINNL